MFKTTKVSVHGLAATRDAQALGSWLVDTVEVAGAAQQGDLRSHDQGRLRLTTTPYEVVDAVELAEPGIL